jgi:hypothetical protein
LSLWGALHNTILSTPPGRSVCPINGSGGEFRGRYTQEAAMLGASAT